LTLTCVVNNKLCVSSALHHSVRHIKSFVAVVEDIFLDGLSIYSV